MQLSAFERSRFHLGHAAMLVNEGLVEFIVDRLSAEHDLRTKTVGILGMAFKREIDDTRDSLAFKLRKLLLFRGARVVASDAFASDPSFVSAEQLVAESGIIVWGPARHVSAPSTSRRRRSSSTYGAARGRMRAPRGYDHPVVGTQSWLRRKHKRSPGSSPPASRTMAN